MRFIKAMLMGALLLLPGVVAAQASTPMPAPPAARTEIFVTRVPGGGPEMHMGPDLGAWWKNSEIVKELSISEQQVKQIEQKFLEHRLKLIDLRADVERQEVKFQPLMEEDQPDETKVGAQLDLLLAARGRLEKANAMMMLAIRKVLTVEQWKKLEAIKESRMRRAMGRFRLEHDSDGETHLRTPALAPSQRTRRPPPDTL